MKYSKDVEDSLEEILGYLLLFLLIPRGQKRRRKLVKYRIHKRVLNYIHRHGYEIKILNCTILIVVCWRVTGSQYRIQRNVILIIGHAHFVILCYEYRLME